MEQERIKYKDVMSLGFKEEICYDSVYFDEFRFEYAIVTLKLTKRISLDWEKETGFCRMIRCDKEGGILNERKIADVEELRDVVDFFLNKNIAQ